MKSGWNKEQTCKKEYERSEKTEPDKILVRGQKSYTDFSAQFLKIVREVYGDDFDFETCTIERGSGCDVVTFQRELD